MGPRRNKNFYAPWKWRRQLLPPLLDPIGQKRRDVKPQEPVDCRPVPSGRDVVAAFPPHYRAVGHPQLGSQGGLA